eukprot:364388-Chlamydomonas_euryale.AAC.22
MTKTPSSSTLPLQRRNVSVPRWCGQPDLPHFPAHIPRLPRSDADVYLLDDPLSAVDSHVSQALFDGCIRGALKHKTVVLVTNALQYLPSADHVLWMDCGRVRAQGVRDSGQGACSRGWGTGRYEWMGNGEI